MSGPYRMLGLLSALVFMPAVPSPAEGEPAVLPLLAAALRGPRVPFEGRQRTEVWTDDRDRVVQTVRVRGDGRGRVRREYLGGVAAGMMTLQIGREMWQRAGGAAWIRLPGDASETDATIAAAAISANYIVSISPPTRMLGRAAVRIDIAPRRPFNPRRRLWLDPNAGLLLRDDFCAPDGRLRSSTAYTDLALTAQPAALFDPPKSAPDAPLFGPSSLQPRTSAASVERETGRPILLPAHVPTGFRIVLYGVMRTGSGRLMPVVRYSDGLAAFTLFQRGMGAGRRGGGPLAAGQCVGQSDRQQSVIAVAGRRSNYLLVGDIAEEELLRVGRSLP